MGTNEYLASAGLFRGLDDAQLAAVLQIATIEMFDAEEMIFSSGELGDCLYIVMDGCVRISLAMPPEGEEALTLLRVGGAFGEMAAIDSGTETRSASAIAHESCTLLRVEKQGLQDLLDRDHGIAVVVLHNVVRSLSEHLRRTNCKILFLSAAGMFE